MKLIYVCLVFIRGFAFLYKAFNVIEHKLGRRVQCKSWYFSEEFSSSVLQSECKSGKVSDEESRAYIQRLSFNSIRFIL